MQPIEAQMIYDHAPVPGPLYWDFKCRMCSQRVDLHANVFQRILWRIRQWRKVKNHVR
ncbi:hypothetical protein SEA_MRMIYAGI_116 [Mycobacterium phage MrMiyagi]|uniref:Uncharacterized protein n=1 Tax=Mycobacterium phage MrMiyagi TaxID=2762395 RepID=A0A7G8LQ14_9CAUD|nr:hypothetical protein SEA_MRMIYAGI_116 [Mycobacterium phage MrMiyagi]